MPETIVDVLCQRAALHPLRPATKLDEGPTLTFGEWHARAERCAAALSPDTGGPDRRVGLIYSNSSVCDGLVAYIGILMSGAAVVPLAPTVTPAEVEQVRRAADLSAIVCCDHRARTATAGLDVRALEVAGAGKAPPKTRPTRADPAEILFTSGTTGIPKGVVASHGNLLLGSDQRPLADPGGGLHIHAIAAGTNLGQTVARVPIMSGDATLVLRRFDPARFADLVVAERPTIATLVPTMATWLVEVAEARRLLFPSFQQITVASAPSAGRLLERLAQLCPNATLRNGYGSTESWPAATFAEVGRDPSGSVGWPGPGHGVRVVDDAGTSLAPGAVGEVVLRVRDGIPVRSYWRDVEATQNVFGTEGVRMGDLGYIGDDGVLYLVERKHDRIVVAGRNVSGIEVEGVLARHPAVVQSAVVGLPDDLLGQHVAAAVVVRSAVEPAALRRFVAERISRYKVPLEIEIVDELPVSSSGKVLKRAVRDRIMLTKTAR